MIRVNRKITGDLGNYINYRYGVDITDTENVPENVKVALLRMQYWIDEVLLEKYFAKKQRTFTELQFSCTELNPHWSISCYRSLP